MSGAARVALRRGARATLAPEAPTSNASSEPKPILVRIREGLRDATASTPPGSPVTIYGRSAGGADA